MILSQIKALLLENNGLSVSQIAQKTGYDKPVVEQALHTWERKGMVSTFTQENPCTHCVSACASRSCAESERLYVWGKTSSS